MNQQQENVSANLTEMWLRGAGVLFDLHTETMRNLLRIQTKNAAMYGAPDFSPMFGEVDERAKRLFSTSAEHMTQYFRQLGQIAEAQCELGRTMVNQTGAAMDDMRSSLETVDRKAREGVDEVKKIVEQTRNSMQQNSRSQPSGQTSESGGTSSRAEQERMKSTAKA